MPFANNFTPGSAREIARTVEKVRMLFPPNPTGGSTATVPLWLAKTTAAHGVGVSQDVTLQTGAKGSETDRTGDTVEAYSRYESFDEDELVIVGLIGEGWEIICPSSSSGGTTSSCDCTECRPIELADIDFGGALLAVQDYEVTIGSRGPYILTYIGGGVWQSDSIDFACAEYDTRPTMFELVATSTDPSGIVLSEYDITDGDEDPDRKLLEQWKNLRTGWLPHCGIELGVIPQPPIDPVCEDYEPYCIACLVPVMPTGGCSCNGGNYVWQVDLGSFDFGACPAGACGSYIAAFSGVNIIPYETTGGSSTCSGVNCLWRKYTPDLLYRLQVQVGLDNASPSKACRIDVRFQKDCAFLGGYSDVAIWTFAISPREYYCDVDEFTLTAAMSGGSPISCATGTITVKPIAV